MKEVKNPKLVIIIFFSLFLMLGLCLGASVVTFIEFIIRNQQTLAVISYILLLTFIIFLLSEMFIFIYYKPFELLTKIRKN